MRERKTGGDHAYLIRTYISLFRSRLTSMYICTLGVTHTQSFPQGFRRLTCCLGSRRWSWLVASKLFEGNFKLFNVFSCCFLFILNVFVKCVKTKMAKDVLCIQWLDIYLVLYYIPYILTLTRINPVNQPAVCYQSYKQ